MKINVLSTLLIMMIMNLSEAQNAGEVLFSNAPINPEEPGAPVTGFKAGDHIYAVAYLPDKVINLYSNTGANPKLEVEIFIYEIKPPLYSYQQPFEEQLTFASMWIKGSVLNNKYLVIDIAPDPNNTTAYGKEEITYKEFGKKYDGPVNFSEALSRLSAGRHDLRVLVKCYYNDAASGKFSIESEDFGQFLNLSQKLNQAAMNAGAKNAGFPKAAMNNAALENKIITAFKNSNDWRSGFIDAAEVIKISILDADWYVRRHEISGAILHRYIRAAIAVKTKAGGCAYYNLVTFQEDYAGGSYQPLRYDGTGDKVMIDCANLK